CLSDADAAGLAPSETAAEEPQATPLYNRKEAAEYLLVDPRTVTRYRINGRLGFIQDGDGRIRYPEDALKACYHWKWGRLPSDCPPGAKCPSAGAPPAPSPLSTRALKA